MSLHKIQRFILAQLSEHDSRRYRDMKPHNMEASQFVYHLKQLQQQGLVTKLSAGNYALSAQGWLYIDRADPDLSLRSQPRVGAMVVCEHPEFGLLYMRRGIQPARGYVGFPIIDIPIGTGQALRDYVRESLQAMTGIGACLDHRADGYINLESEGQLAGSLLAHVFTARYETGELKSHQLFDFSWEQELAEADRSKILESSDYVVQQLNTNEDSFFFFEHSFALPTR